MFAFYNSIHSFYMKASKTYHLAHQVSCLPTASPKTQSHLSSLPCYIKEEQGSHRIIPSHKQLNIFGPRNPVQLRKIDLNSEENYKFVGLRELRSYQSRTEKKKRNMNSFNRRSSDTAMSISRVSSSKTLQQSFLTKEEIVKKVFAIKADPCQKKQEIFVEEQNSFLQQTIGLIDTSGCITLKSKDSLLNNGISQPKHINKSASISRVKTIMKRYENQWDGFIKNRKNLENQANIHKKYQSVLQNVVSFRGNIELKQRYDQIERTVNVKPNEWQYILRSDKSLKNMHQRQLNHTCAKGIKLVGVSKSIKQMEWLQKKDKQGYFFKLMAAQTKRP